MAFSCCDSPTIAAGAERLATVLADATVEAWAGCLVIVTDHKVRVRRPNRPNRARLDTPIPGP
jgi:hypothetical protein